MSPLPPPYDAERLRRWPWSAYRVALVVIAGLTACVLFQLKLTYDKAIRDAETLVSTLAVTSEQHIGGSLAAIDALLDELAATIREGRQDDPRFREDFAARLPSYPEIRYIAVADAAGTLSPRAWPANAPGGTALAVAVRQFLASLRDLTGPARMVIGEPVVAQPGGERTLHLSRPVRDRAGQFAGVVVAAINPDVYATFLSSILYDEAGSCGLITQGGRMIARAPNHAREFGRDIADSDLIRLWVPRAPTGVAHLVAKTDSNDKLLAYRLMPEFSLMVTAGVSRDKALSGWRRMAAVEAALLAAFSGLLLYWIRRIRHQNGALDAELRNLEATIAGRTRELEEARALAERRALQLGLINNELRRLTLVASHHLQEPVRSIVSCSQMLPRALPRRVLALENLIDQICRQGMVLKTLLSDFERRIGVLTTAIRSDGTDRPHPAPPAKAAPHKTPYSARGLAAAIIATLLTGNALQLRSDYHAAVGAAEELTTAVAKSITHYLLGSLRRVGSLLEEVALAVEDGRHLSEPFGERLLSRLETMPEVRMITLADADGRISPQVWPAGSGLMRDADVATQPYFREQAAIPRRNRLTIGRPYHDPATGERLVHIGCPLIGAQGGFDGVVIASVDPDLYARFLNTVLLDDNGATAVISRTGQMVARAPRHEEKFGIDIANSDLFTRFLPQSPAGIAHLISKADGNDKLLAYRTLDDIPLVVTSGYSMDKALAGWKVSAVIATLLALTASAILYLWAQRADRHGRLMAGYRRRLAEEVAQRTAGLSAAHQAAESHSAHLAEANDRLHDLIRLIAAGMDAPLRQVAGQVSSLQSLAGGQSEEADRWLSFITAATVHLQALLRDYPRYVEMLCASPSLDRVDSQAVAEDTARQVAAHWGENRIRVRAEGLPRLAADPAMLAEIFRQLFSNSAAHATDGHPVTATVTASRQGPVWRLEVADDGPGLPPINSEHLFRAFETAHDRDPDSTGLGLPLCRVIVQAHGGRIWATSRPGKGCSVHFTLPAVDDGGEDRPISFPLAGNSGPA